MFGIVSVCVLSVVCGSVSALPQCCCSTAPVLPQYRPSAHPVLVQYLHSIDPVLPQYCPSTAHSTPPALPQDCHSIAPVLSQYWSIVSNCAVSMGLQCAQTVAYQSPPICGWAPHNFSISAFPEIGNVHRLVPISHHPLVLGLSRISEFLHFQKLAMCTG